jgi:anthranilate synthase/indole-3-glycerol phosphate synthase/phosphoribosylanthranilate isomerase
MSLNKLQEIKLQRILDVQNDSIQTPLSNLQANISSCQIKHPPDNLQITLLSKPPNNFSLHVAAEFKKASPSKGDMTTEIMNVKEQVFKYTAAGATLVSVLTEPKWFKGSLQDMYDARLVVEEYAHNNGNNRRSLILRKDFVVHEYQIYEARIYGADTILLIVAITEQTDLVKFISTSRLLGMEPLVEAANEDETRRALEAGARVIGINNRDLATFKLDMTTTTRCAKIVEQSPLGKDVIILSLSGIKTRDDVKQYEQQCPCVRGILVGEHLMKSTNPMKEIRDLVVDDQTSTTTMNNMDGGKQQQQQQHNYPWIKICGIVQPQDALIAARAGANFIGLIFVPESPRLVNTMNEARAVVETIWGYRESKSRANINVTIPLSSSSPTKRTKGVEGDDVDGILTYLNAGRDGLKSALVRGPLVVGVFMNQDIHYVNQIVQDVGLDLVQFHGNETKEECAKCIVPYIKVLHVVAAGGANSTETSNHSSENTVTIDNTISTIHQYVSPTSGPIAILLDTTMKSGTSQGGTGIAFDWKIAGEIQLRGYPLMVAGGLTPTNVKEAVKASGNPPMGIDCSSGVQVKDNARRKDEQAIIEFIKGARTLV